MIFVFWGYAHAIINDADFDQIINMMRFVPRLYFWVYTYITALRRELDCIADQVSDDLNKPVSIPQNIGEAWCTVRMLIFLITEEP